MYFMYYKTNIYFLNAGVSSAVLTVCLYIIQVLKISKTCKYIVGLTERIIILYSLGVVAKRVGT